MGKKTPEGINKDAIVLANGDMPIDELALYKNFTGWVQYEGGRGYRAGLTKEGSSDLVGPYSLVITPDMVGKTVAVFCAFEVKADEGRETPEQARFGASLARRGGLYAVVRKPSDIKEAICRYLLKLRHK